jgi:hypothetical protein
LSTLQTYLELLPYARLIGIQGHGEPLANPKIEEILSTISNLVDPRATGYIITNGTFLAKHLPLLIASRIAVYNVSLNAATEQTHNVVMGLGRDKLPAIIESIKQIVHLRETERPDIQATISLVLTADNVHEAADFVHLGNDLRVDRIYLRTLMPQTSLPMGLNYHLLPPKLHPEFATHADRAVAAIAKSRVPVEAQPETWASDTIPQTLRDAVDRSPPPITQRSDAIKNKSIRTKHQMEQSTRVKQGIFGRKIDDVFDLTDNPYGRTAPFPCRFVYQNLITTQLTMEMFPCCYMYQIPGHQALVLEPEHPFMTYWNSDAMVNLRRRLRRGPLFQACATCPMQG